MNDVSDLRSTIVPKSDQLNADQLVTGPMEITVTAVNLGSTPEQPVIVHYEGEAGRPYKPCKTMRRVLILAWGEDGNKWAGKNMRLYHDPAVKFGGDEVGGIRISHLSHIDKTISVKLSATKAKKALHVIEPMKAATIRPERTERHINMIADFELLAREQGFDEFKAAWERTPKEDRAAIGAAERDRIGAVGRQADQRKPDSNQPAQ